MIDADEVEIFTILKIFGKKWTVEALTNNEVKKFDEYEQKEVDGSKQIKKLMTMAVYRKFLWFKIKFPAEKLKNDQLLFLKDRIYDFAIGTNFTKKAKEAEQARRNAEQNTYQNHS